MVSSYWRRDLVCISKLYPNCCCMLWASLFVKLQMKPWPAATGIGHLSLSGNVEGAAPMETSRLSHQLLSFSPFLIPQEVPRGCCLDCDSFSVLYIFSHCLQFSRVFFDLSILVSMKYYTWTQRHTKYSRFLPSLFLYPSFTWGWVGQQIWFALSSYETAAIRQRTEFIYWVFHIRGHYSECALCIITSY